MKAAEQAVPNERALARGVRLLGVAALAMVLGVIVAGLLRWLDQSPANAPPPAPLAEPVRSQAYRHLPEGCEVVVRFDLERARAVPAFEAQFTELVDTLARESSSDPRAKQAAQLAERAGIDPAKDLTDALLCGVDVRGPGRAFLLVLGGDLRPRALVASLAGVSREGKLEATEVEGRPALRVHSDRSDGWWTFGQADDGAIVFASDPKLYAAALATTDRYATRYHLATDAEASFVVGASFIDRTSLLRSRPIADALASLRSVRGVATLSTPKVELHFDMQSAQKAAQLEGLLRSRILPTYLERAGEGEGDFGELEALRGAVTRASGDETVVELPWSAGGVDKLLKKLATLALESSRRER